MNPTPDPREGSSINNRTRGWIRESERWTKSQPDESLVRKFTYLKKNQIEMLKVKKKSMRASPTILKSSVVQEMKIKLL